jgi:hypothetical protein
MKNFKRVLKKIKDACENKKKYKMKICADLVGMVISMVIEKYVPKIGSLFPQRLKMMEFKNITLG